MRRFLFFIGLIGCGGLVGQSNKNQSVETDFSLELEVENRYFFDEGAFQGQEDYFPGFSIRPKYSLEWNEGSQALNFHGFARWDLQDDNRTHWDIRELYWQTIQSNWELSIGAKKIFWGVTESIHLVDVINQTDLVENSNGEEKLGQPMVHFSYLANFGTIDLFALPYARKLQFPAQAGRFRFSEVIDRSDIGFQNEDFEAFYPSFAFRWSNYVGPFDYGLSYFHGTGREPFFQISPDNGQLEFFYPINNQIGLDLQAITGPVLWKFESYFRSNDFQDFIAFAGGFEYTFSNIRNTGIDIGVLGEYLYDERGINAFSGFDNDLFFGSRLAFNDVKSTELLFGGIIDLTKSTGVFTIEGSRRFGASWKATIEARILNNVSSRELLIFFAQDSFGRISLSKYF